MEQFVVGLDLGQSKDYTALAVVERVPAIRCDYPGTAPEDHYHLRHLERPPLGTLYTAIVTRVQELLATPPLTNISTPLVVDKTGVGAAVLDMFTAAGLRPYGVTITGGDKVVQDHGRHSKVPKRDLVGLLVALFQSGRLKVARDLELAPLLLNELLNFKLKVNVQTAHDSYEAWRESIHDDLVLATALACWHAESGPALPFGWLTGSDTFRGQTLGVDGVKQEQPRQPTTTLVRGRRRLEDARGAAEVEAESWWAAAHGALWRDGRQ